VPIERMEGLAAEYRDAQTAVPAGERVFVAASFPTHFDFARNKILVADIPGAASLPPGMPVFEGPAAVKTYLLSQGIRYVIYSEGDNIQNMYSRAFWEDVREHPERATPDIVNVSRFNLAFLDDLHGLVRNRTALHRGQTVVVVRLD